MSASRLEDWVAAFVERREGGEPVDVRAFVLECTEDEAQREALGRALKEALAAEALFPSAPGGGAGSAPVQVGPYRILGLLGRGATSRVFRAQHQDRPDELVALKILEDDALLHPRALTRFQRESEMLRGLKHPHVAEWIDAGMHGDTPYLVLQLLEGRSLASLLAEAHGAEGPESAAGGLERGSADAASEAAGLVAKLARGVHALHERGIVHRDLKPGNVVLHHDQPVLVDLGLAHGVDHSTLTRSGDVLGTVPYMAPEQARGEASDLRVDVYGLGAILFELLCGRPPHVGDEAVQVLARVQKRPAPAPRSLVPGLPPALDRIARRALAFRASRRFATAAELAEELEAFASGRPTRSRDPSVLQRAGDLWSVRQVELVAALVVLAALGGGVWLALRPAPAAPEAAFDLEGARREAERAIASDWSRAQASLDSKTRQQARARILRAAQDFGSVAPEDPAASLYRALASDELDAPLEEPLASALLEGERWRRSGRAEDAVRRLREAAGLSEGAPLPTAMLALAAVEHPDDEVGDRELSNALRLFPGDPVFERFLAEILGRRGEAAYEARRDQEAAELFQRATRLNPRGARLWQRLAFARHRIQDFEGALQAAQAMMALPLDDAAQPMALRTLAVALDEEGRRDEAIEILDGIVEQDPEYLLAWQSLARMLDSECRLAEACEAYRGLLDHDPGSVDAWGGLAHLHSGSGRGSCEKCDLAFADHPELLDPEAAQEAMIEYLHASRGRHSALVWMAQSVSRTRPCDPVLELLEEMIEDEDDERVLGRLVKARRVLEGD